MIKPKVARTIEDARLWAATFSDLVVKEEKTVKCPHGNVKAIDLIYKGQKVDSIMGCQQCWSCADDNVRVD